MARPKKTLTRQQLEGRKEKAERFTRDVLEDPERADEIGRESLEEYAARRKIELSNPTKRRKRRMATRRRLSREQLEHRVSELEEENSDLQEENSDLQEKLDDVASIVSPEEEDAEEEDEEE
jgi:hypothetical protein